MPAPARRPSPVREWGLVVAAAVVLLAVVWAFGGFAPAAALGRPYRAGQVVELRRWQIQVDSAAYTDQARAGYDVDPRIRIVMRVTNLDERTQISPTEKMITVRVAGRELSDEQLATGDGRSFNFDPGVPAALVYDFAWPVEGSADPPTPPGTVTVLLRDERERQNFINDTSLVAGDVVASVRLPCPDERSNR